MGNWLMSLVTDDVFCLLAFVSACLIIVLVIDGLASLWESINHE